MSEYIQIGKLVATYGFKGEIVLQHVLKKQSDFKHAEAIFIEEFPDSYLPFFRQKGFAKNASETIIKLEGIDTKESAAKLISKKVWLQKNHLDFCFI